jgi:hypothetical protein
MNATAPADRPVALITVGQPRTVASAVCVASFELLRASLTSRQTHHFMWMNEAKPPTSVTRRTRLSDRKRLAISWARPLDRTGAEWQAALRVYAPVRLIFSSDALRCRPQCRLRCDTVSREAPIEWLRQFYAVAQAWQMVLEYERDTQRTHGWYVRLRPDMVHLQPLTSLAHLDPAAVYVPSGVMTRAVAFLSYNDHMLICASHASCEPCAHLPHGSPRPSPPHTATHHHTPPLYIRTTAPATGTTRSCLLCLTPAVYLTS